MWREILLCRCAMSSSKKNTLESSTYHTCPRYVHSHPPLLSSPLLSSISTSATPIPFPSSDQSHLTLANGPSSDCHNSMHLMLEIVIHSLSLSLSLSGSLYLHLLVSYARSSITSYLLSPLHPSQASLPHIKPFKILAETIGSMQAQLSESPIK